MPSPLLGVLCRSDMLGRAGPCDTRPRLAQGATEPGGSYDASGRTAIDARQSRGRPRKPAAACRAGPGTSARCRPGRQDAERARAPGTQLTRPRPQMRPRRPRWRRRKRNVYRVRTRGSGTAPAGGRLEVLCAGAANRPARRRCEQARVETVHPCDLFGGTRRARRPPPLPGPRISWRRAHVVSFRRLTGMRSVEEFRQQMAVRPLDARADMKRPHKLILGRAVALRALRPAPPSRRPGKEGTGRPGQRSCSAGPPTRRREG